MPLQFVPSIRVDLDSAVPAYRQITDTLRVLIMEGRLEPGERLPTVRELAIQLCVHHNTVAEAYRQLEGEGMLELKRGRGATVRGHRPPKASGTARRQFAQKVRELAAKARADGLKQNEIASILNAFARERSGKT